MITLAILSLLIWIVGGIFSYASSFAASDSDCPYDHRENVGMSVILGVLGGPIPFLVDLIVGDYKKYGLKFW